MDKDYFEGREVMQELIRRFDIPMTIKNGTTFLQNVRLELEPDDFPKLYCTYVIGKLEGEQSDKVIEEL